MTESFTQTENGR